MALGFLSDQQQVPPLGGQVPSEDMKIVYKSQTDRLKRVIGIFACLFSSLQTMQLQAYCNLRNRLKWDRSYEFCSNLNYERKSDLTSTVCACMLQLPQNNYSVVIVINNFMEYLLCSFYEREKGCGLKVRYLVSVLMIAKSKQSVDSCINSEGGGSYTSEGRTIVGHAKMRMPPGGPDVQTERCIRDCTQANNAIREQQLKRMKQLLTQQPNQKFFESVDSYVGYADTQYMIRNLLTSQKQ